MTVFEIDYARQRKERLEESVHEYLEDSHTQLIPDLRTTLEAERLRLTREVDRVDNLLSKLKY